MRPFVLAAASAALLLAACSSGPSLDEGKVIEKSYDDPDDWYQPGYTIDGGQSCSGGYNGQPRICTQNPDINMPGMWHHDPEHFRLKLQAPNPNDSAKTITDTREVPEAFFNEVRVGQWVNVETLEIIPK